MAVSPSISSWSLLQPSPWQAQILVLPEWLLHLCLQPQGCSWTGRLSLLSPQWEASLHIRDEKEKAGFWRQHWGDRDKMGTENWISASGTSGLSFHHWGSTLCLLTLLSTSIFILEIQSIPHFLIVFFGRLHICQFAKLMSIESVIPSNYLILSHTLLLLPSIFSSIRLFSNESALHIMWSKYWSLSISPSHEYSWFISFKIDWFDLLVVQRTLKSLL